MEYFGYAKIKIFVLSLVLLTSGGCKVSDNTVTDSQKRSDYTLTKLKSKYYVQYIKLNFYHQDLKEPLKVSEIVVNGVKVDTAVVEVEADMKYTISANYVGCHPLIIEKLKVKSKDCLIINVQLKNDLTPLY